MPLHKSAFYTFITYRLIFYTMHYARIMQIFANFSAHPNPECTLVRTCVSICKWPLINIDWLATYRSHDCIFDTMIEYLHCISTSMWQWSWSWQNRYIFAWKIHGNATHFMNLHDIHETKLACIKLSTLYPVMGTLFFNFC